MSTAKELSERRQRRIRNRLRSAAGGRPRLSVFRSSKHIYAQIIDDAEGRTLVSASSLEKEQRGERAYGGNVEAASAIGKLVAERARQAGIEAVVFDRGARRYHGRVKALAEAAREAGLKF
jgi:large subunit ribosomal protein L18